MVEAAAAAPSAPVAEGAAPPAERTLTARPWPTRAPAAAAAAVAEVPPPVVPKRKGRPKMSDEEKSAARERREAAKAKAAATVAAAVEGPRRRRRNVHLENYFATADDGLGDSSDDAAAPAGDEEEEDEAVPPRKKVPGAAAPRSCKQCPRCSQMVGNASQTCKHCAHSFHGAGPAAPRRPQKAPSTAPVEVNSEELFQVEMEEDGERILDRVLGRRACRPGDAGGSLALPAGPGVDERFAHSYLCKFRGESAHSAEWFAPERIGQMSRRSRGALSRYLKRSIATESDRADAEDDDADGGDGGDDAAVADVMERICDARVLETTVGDSDANNAKRRATAAAAYADAAVHVPPPHKGVAEKPVKGGDAGRPGSAGLAAEAAALGRAEEDPSVARAAQPPLDAPSEPTMMDVDDTESAGPVATAADVAPKTVDGAAGDAAPPPDRPPTHVLLGFSVQQRPPALPPMPRSGTSSRGRPRSSPDFDEDDDEEDDGEEDDDEAAAALRRSANALRRQERLERWRPLARCEAVLLRLMDLGDAEPFLSAVDANLLPDYAAIVPRPMDLGTVLRQLRAGAYSPDNVDKFRREVKLVWHNCRRYNDPESVIWRAAVALGMTFDRLFEAWVASADDAVAPRGWGPEAEAAARPWEPLCRVCCTARADDETQVILCDHCDAEAHVGCARAPPAGDETWHCAACLDKAKRLRLRGLASARAEDEYRARTQRVHEKSLDAALDASHTRVEYLVKWEGTSYKDCTWERKTAVPAHLVDQFQREQRRDAAAVAAAAPAPAPAADADADAHAAQMPAAIYQAAQMPAYHAQLPAAYHAAQMPMANYNAQMPAANYNAQMPAANYYAAPMPHYAVPMPPANYAAGLPANYYAGQMPTADFATLMPPANYYAAQPPPADSLAAPQMPPAATYAALQPMANYYASPQMLPAYYAAQMHAVSSYASPQFPADLATLTAISGQPPSAATAPGPDAAGPEAAAPGAGAAAPGADAAASVAPAPRPGGRVLRDYQRAGVDWLVACLDARRGSVLADEMGLGKTAQVCVYLETARGALGPRPAAGAARVKPFLVVVPLSTVEHWRRELAAWTDCQVCVYHDAGRDARDLRRHFEWWPRNARGAPAPNAARDGTRFDVLVTTYDELIRDADDLGSVSWAGVVVDEAHRLKNVKGRLLEQLQAVLRLGVETRAFQHRVLLSGTPLQNDVRELWTLLNFIEPQQFALQLRPAFDERFGAMTTAGEVCELRALLAPHLLRRVKEDVARDIPVKRETVIDVELTMTQKRYYRALYERNISALAALHARQQPHERRKDAEDDADDDAEEAAPPGASPRPQKDCVIAASGKTILLDKLLPKLRREGHKVLIFSQMVRMLDLLAELCAHRGYPHEMLDGRVNGADRQRAIDRFNTQPDAFVFLLSTRAGGVGINLVAADTVVIYDSDWNPQNDVQAQARCHRLGQTRDVAVYRLVARRSFEGEMLARASRKLGLERAIMSPGAAGDAGVPQGPSASELEALLRHGAYALADDANDATFSEFRDADIEKILAERSTVRVVDAGAPAAGESANPPEACETHSAPRLDVDDPAFWEKAMPDMRTPELLTARLDR
ncbi:hypothetical protein M885DRAFT_474220, partial [Pelagophyceae sp. CCMP2097]